MKYLLLFLISIQWLQASTDDQLPKCVSDASKVLGVNAKTLVINSRDDDLLTNFRKSHTQIGLLVNDLFNRANESHIEFKMTYFVRDLTLKFTSYEDSKVNVFDIQIIFDTKGELEAVRSRLRFRISELEPDQLNGVDSPCPPVEPPPPPKNRLTPKP
jgi:hypothetical protein